MARPHWRQVDGDKKWTVTDGNILSPSTSTPVWTIL